MDFVEFKDIFFKDHDIYHTLSDYEKGKHQFMLHRMLSIRFPIQVESMNRLGMEGNARVVDFWFNWMKLVSKGVRGVPEWANIYPDVKPKQKSKWYPKNKNNLLKYLQFNEISKREFDEMVDIDSEYMKNDYSKFEKTLD